MIEQNSLRLKFKNDLLFQLSFWSIALFPLLLQLPIGFGFRYSFYIRILVIIPLLSVILFQIICSINKKLFVFERKNNSIIIIFFVLWFLAICRSILISSFIESIFFLYDLSVFVLLVLLIRFSFLLGHKDHYRSFRLALIFSFGLYVIVNLILYLIGVRSTHLAYYLDYQSQMLSFFGIAATRILFPMADGINNYGILCGAVLVASLYSFINEYKLLWKMYFAVVTLSCVVSILMTDSRGALFFSISAFLLVYVLRKYYIFLVTIAIFISILPLLATNSVSFLQYDWLELYKRPSLSWDTGPSSALNYNEVCEQRLIKSSGVLSNRIVIWEAVLDEISSPKIVHLVGYGYRGHVISGISNQYSCIFKSYVLGKLASAHNLWLQLFLDIGYLGIGVTIASFYITTHKLTKLFEITLDYTFISLCGVIIYTVLIGALEASISPDFNLLFNFVCSIIIVTIIEWRINFTP